MKKFLLPVIILVVALIGYGVYSSNAPKNQEGLTKSEVEEIYGRDISNEEWNKMTNHGKTPIIGGGNAETEMELDHN